MRATSERRLIDTLSWQLAAGGTAMADAVRFEPAGNYTDPARQAGERELFFRRYPLVVRPGSSIPNPGDFVTDDIAGIPVLLVRGDDRRVRTFLNVCRHRANRVCAEESGNRRVFSCQYHAWTYDREGNCRTFVDHEGFAGLDRADFGLLAFPTEERHGLVWVVPDAAAAIDVRTYLGPELDDDLAGFSVAGQTVFAEQTFHLPFDWKLAPDTFLEVFHLAYLHRDTVGPLFIGNFGAYEEFDRHHRYTAVRKTFPEMTSQPVDEQSLFPHSSIVHLLFPNTIFTWQLDHLELWQSYPGSAGEQSCVVRGSMFVPEAPATDSALRHWTRNWDILRATVAEEDFDTMTAVQRNLSTGALEHLVFGRNEVALQHFHQVLDDELARHGNAGRAS